VSANQLGARRARFEQDGYVVLPQATTPERVAAAQRLLHLAIRRHGLTPQEILDCQQSTFFPHLRWEPEIWGVLPEDAAELLGWTEGDEWAEPQILMRFPDEEQPWPLEPHLDESPSWAQGRPYRGIVGVALTTAGDVDGAVSVWPGSHVGRTSDPVPVPVAAGDALVMHPALLHSGSLNLGASIRSAIYFRLVSAASEVTSASSSMSMSTSEEPG
jgi:Phytanoyl-CoA dioxygenase (PhyH)